MRKQSVIFINAMIQRKEILEAYSDLIEQKMINRQLPGVDSNNVRSWRARLKDDPEKVGTAHMLDVLNKAGALKLTAPEIGDY